MQKNFFALIALSACTLTAAHAQGYYSSQDQNNNGYSSNAGYSSSSSTDSTTYTSTAMPAHKEHKKKHNQFSFSVSLPGEETIAINNHGIRPASPKIEWISMHTGQPLPKHAVIGGGERQGLQYVCRANYHGGLHPGKLYQGSCDISWGGRQIPMSSYEILSSKKHLEWVASRHGGIPRGAIQGGEENGQPLYICQAEYRGGRHSGKVVGQNCNFAWGDGEVSVPYYNVLVY